MLPPHPGVPGLPTIPSVSSVPAQQLPVPQNLIFSMSVDSPHWEGTLLPSLLVGLSDPLRQSSDDNSFRNLLDFNTVNWSDVAQPA